MAPPGVSATEYLLTLNESYFRLEPNVEDGVLGNEQNLECADGEQLVIRAGYGDGYCEEEIGTYGWRHAGSELALRLVSDPGCPSRAFLLAKLRWRPRN